ncbi:alpha-L-fucosidase [Cohnella sp. GCM10020058]|uniref:alpha-L-fucosidase n=1 Tax=Cohnella sp. GCM10020058 TaxID=3317330 RepID=UPI00363881AC
MGEIDWMQQGPFGLMVHYLKQVKPKDGAPIEDWDELVDAFPVASFCREVEATGAKWLIFTLGQNNGYYCSPNPVLEALLPGRCSKRDLALEIATNLEARGIRFIAYLPSEVDTADEALRDAFGWDIDPSDKSVFQERYMDFIRSWSERWGAAVDGWWFDGCYDAAVMSFMRTHGWNNGRFDYASWAGAAKAGNPAAVVSMNPGADEMGYAFAEQDYLGGEANDLKQLPTGPLVDGMQWQALVWMDCFWMHDRDAEGTIPPPRFTEDEMYAYTAACRRQGGAVTWNIGVYQEGTLSEPSADRLARVAERLREMDEEIRMERRMKRDG